MLNEGLATNLHLKQAHTTVSPNMKHLTLATLKPRISVTILSTPDVTRNGRQTSSHPSRDPIVTRDLQASLSSCRRDVQHPHQLHATLSFLPDKLTVTQLVKKFQTFCGIRRPNTGFSKAHKMGPTLSRINPNPHHPTLHCIF